MIHPALAPGHAAVVTGGAGGIGLASARRFVEAGLSVLIADANEAALESAAAELRTAASGGARILARKVDVAERGELEALADEAFAAFGRVNVLMNNAGIQPGSGIFGPEEAWARVLAVNLGGVVSGCQTFVPRMLASGEPGLVINTGSKQGITTPPGDPAYNVVKAGVKAFTEALEHELRGTEGGRISAKLLIPGFVFTRLTAKGRTEKPAGAWTPDETADFMLERIAAGDFYILCPDGEVTREMDEARILWAAGDIVDNRPPLSRWHGGYDAEFKAFLAERTKA
ncbi:MULTISPECIES: SDR family NAD(P)-dependent oxidoreductase [unclassified Aureimonas]|uniref:SDR family NAD(P)-dependent oxidoreductase n=1 Tax=unclassified Aureimonas TaxID=2615206 RepID=UPI0006FD193C|nr:MULTISPECIES: SDR family NAD(P)-dependent oxidoreductase [unclassified Aureimonas]KQT64120.1 short-chain dehydrogenase [Aureimonas sp. Leaf427]KQT81309.1 short-chain dehydrogenase [Aureimonas sp. Leaf460]